MLAEDLKPKKYHEIVSSVGVIKNMAELLLEDEVDTLKKEMLLRIKAQAEKVAELAPPE